MLLDIKRHNRLVSFFIFFLRISQNAATKISILSCEASFDAEDHECYLSMDGQYTDTARGWAVHGDGGGLPQNVVYELEEVVKVDHVRILTAVDRVDHHLTALSLEEIVLFPKNIFIKFFSNF